MSADSIETQNPKNSQEFQNILDQELRSFVVPILIAPDLELRPSEIHNATGLLLNLGDKKCLVTCYHVWEELQHRNGKNSPGVLIALLNDGYGGAFRINRPTLLTKDEKLGLAKELDLVVIDFTGVEGISEKKCFPFGSESIHDAKQGDVVVTMGFPGMWRKSEKNFTRVKSGPLPFVVEDVTQKSLIISERNHRNQEVFSYLDAEPRVPESKDSCGGLSGAPAFYVNQKPFKIAGFIIERAFGILRLTRASLVKELI
jgi:hypothetical protein